MQFTDTARQPWDGVPGPSYVLSADKLAGDQRFAQEILPYAKAISNLTELAIYGSFDADHLLLQPRQTAHGIQDIPKLRTMRHLLPDEVMDIDHDSKRIINIQAQIARVLGFDEMKQWELVADGILSRVGPRPLLNDCINRIATLGSQAGVPTAKIDAWHEYQGMVTGMFGRSQAFRRLPTTKEHSPSDCATIIRYDLDDMRQASPRYDNLVIAKCVGVSLRAATQKAMRFGSID